MRGGLLTLAGIGLFAGLLFWMTLHQGGVECEVCVEFGGRVACGAVSAPTSDTAMAQARDKACGLLAQGMTAELQCQRGPLHSATCSE